MPPAIADYRFAFNRRIGAQVMPEDGNAGSDPVLPKVNGTERLYCRK
ncbi:hypothetical protein AGMMS50268_18470 [Spirochaetia bacterium]|nr:hypothetical protein AGMMS50268_18470 [Spirochaetia bacterium]